MASKEAIDEAVAFAVSVGRDVFDGEERTPPEVDRARAACEQLLSAPLAIDDVQVWQLLLASAVLTGEDNVAFLVHELADGEAVAECPQCKRSSSLVNDGEQIRLESDEVGAGEDGTRDPSRSLPAEIIRLAARARTAEHPAIAASLELLASRVQCPFCKKWSPAIETLDALRA